LEKAAKEAVEVIRGKGKDGAAAADLKKFGIIGSPKKWFAQYVPQAKVKMRGQKAKARHFVD
jgi:hypothetical protein